MLRRDPSPLLTASGRLPSRAAVAGLAVVLAAGLTGCAGDPEERTAKTSAGSAVTDDPSTTATATATASASPSPGASAAPSGSAEPDVPDGFLPLPTGPRTPTPSAPPSPGSLAALDWSQRVDPAPCPDPEVGAAVAGDLDADGVDEVGVPVRCPGPGSVPVFAGTAEDPRRLGDALPAEERARLYAVEVRDGHLVVTAVRPAEGGGEDTAVTTRWVVRGGQLTRTDRWEDPASVLGVDHDEDGDAAHD